MTSSIDELLGADTIFIIGSNTTENHSVIGAEIRPALRSGTMLIVAGPRKIDLSNDADVFLQIKPGTNIALVNAMMHVILKEGLENKEFIQRRTESYVEINPDTALKLGIDDGDKVKVSSRRGSITVKAKVSDIVEESVVFIPFHFAEGAANMLTNAALDPACKISEYKVCAVNLEKAV